MTVAPVTGGTVQATFMPGLADWAGMITSVVKANASDTLDLGTVSGVPVKTIRFVGVMNKTDTVIDTVSISGTTITFAQGTGIRDLFVVGECK